MDTEVPQKSARIVLTRKDLIEHQDLLSNLFKVPKEGKWEATLVDGDFWKNERILYLSGDRVAIEPILHVLMPAIMRR